MRQLSNLDPASWQPYLYGDDWGHSDIAPGEAKPQIWAGNLITRLLEFSGLKCGFWHCSWHERLH